MVGRDARAGAAPAGVRRPRSPTARASCSRSSAPPGVGKSRLVEEFLATLGASATVLRGRCLPYGEGITFFPVVEVVKEAAGPGGLRRARGRRAEDLLRCSEADEHRASSAERVAQLMGVGGVATARPRRRSGRSGRFFEALARDGPLVAGVRRHPLGRADVPRPDRAHRRLVARRADPVLCMARPDLLDIRPALGRRQAQRDHDLARAALRRRVRRPDRRTSSGRPSCPTTSRRPDRRPRPKATRCSSRRCSRC